MKEIGQSKKICIMAATHNEETVRFVIKKYVQYNKLLCSKPKSTSTEYNNLIYFSSMKEHGIKRSDRVVCFGQLYGMCDQVSFPLGKSS